MTNYNQPTKPEKCQSLLDLDQDLAQNYLVLKKSTLYETFGCKTEGEDALIMPRECSRLIKI